MQARGGEHRNGSLGGKSSERNGFPGNELILATGIYFSSDLGGIFRRKQLKQFRDIRMYFAAAKPMVKAESSPQLRSGPVIIRANVTRHERPRRKQRAEHAFTSM